MGLSHANGSSKFDQITLFLRKATEPSWSYVIEKQERWNGLVIKDLC